MKMRRWRWWAALSEDIFRSWLMLTFSTVVVVVLDSSSSCFELRNRNFSFRYFEFWNRERETKERFNAFENICEKVPLLPPPCVASSKIYLVVIVALQSDPWWPWSTNRRFKQKKTEKMYFFSFFEYRKS